MREQIGKLIGPLYVAGARVHQFLYDVGFFKRKKAPCSILSVGSIISGGAGKTPFALWLAQLLKSKGHKVALLSRGYKRRSKKPVAVAADHSACQVGDEPIHLFQKLGNIPVLVGRDRCELAKWATSNFGVKICILDDGMQHRELQRDLEIVMIDSTRPLGEGLLLPRRDPISALQRADIIVLNRAEQVSKKALSELQNWAKKIAPFCLLVESRYALSALSKVDEIGQFQPKQLENTQLFAFAGIANPKSFEMTLIGAGMNVVGKNWFSDHQAYDLKHIEIIKECAMSCGADALITTSKDGVKLVNQARNLQLPCYVVDIDVQIGLKDSDLIYKKVLKCVTS